MPLFRTLIFPQYAHYLVTLKQALSADFKKVFPKLCSARNIQGGASATPLPCQPHRLGPSLRHGGGNIGHLLPQVSSPDEQQPQQRRDLLRKARSQPLARTYRIKIYLLTRCSGDLRPRLSLRITDLAKWMRMGSAQALK